MKDPLWGTTVTVLGTLRRETQVEPQGRDLRGVWRRDIVRRVWVRYPMSAPLEALVIGQRTLSEGRVEQIYSGEQPLYFPERHFKAYLVVKDGYTAPIYVLPFDIEGRMTPRETQREGG